ncbi:hypothetical protein [Flavobacterium suncheonense]|nr:hypothetical protein [Flavobacterium suncheonense]
MEILFKQWNSSGRGLENAIGISNKKVFILNQLRDSINYYELNNKSLIYKPSNSVKVKIDSLGNVCVPDSYKF